MPDPKKETRYIEPIDRNSHASLSSRFRVVGFQEGIDDPSQFYVNMLDSLARIVFPAVKACIWQYDDISGPSYCLKIEMPTCLTTELHSAWARELDAFSFLEPSDRCEFERVISRYLEEHFSSTFAVRWSTRSLDEEEC
jgi:hypothetical protein